MVTLSGPISIDLHFSVTRPARQCVISDLKLEDTKRKDSNTAILILNFTFKICLIKKKKNFDNNIYLWSHR